MSQALQDDDGDDDDVDVDVHLLAFISPVHSVGCQFCNIIQIPHILIMNTSFYYLFIPHPFDISTGF